MRGSPPSPWTATRSRSTRRCSASRTRSATRSSACWPRTRTRRSARWATTRRCRCCRTRCARCTTTSASSSRRSPTRRSTRCARPSSCRCRRRSGRSATSSSPPRSTRARSCSARRSCRSASCARSWRSRRSSHEFLDLQYDPAEGLEAAIGRLCAQAESAVREGKLVLLLSDRYLVRGRIPAHALLVTGAVHHRLVKTGLRCKCNLLVETGTAREPHHFACLIGYGATAVYPYMAYQMLFEMMRKGHVKLDFAARLELGRSYRAGLRKGLFKIMSKMGISTIASYRGSQLFEIVGLARRGGGAAASPARRAGCAARTSPISRPTPRTLAAQAWNPRESIGQGGLLKYVHGGEYHMYNPDVIAALQAAVVTGDVRALPPVRAPGERAAAVHVPRPARAHARRRRRCRSTRSSRRPRSSRASTAPACRSGRCRPRRTRRSRSR